MEFTEEIKEFAKKILEKKDKVLNEEATKMAMIVPFFSLLGYDVSNPMEFFPEYTADIGIKKKEKVDYAIIINDNLEILVECKCCNEKLEKHQSQLFKYFCATSAKFAILTNGIQYKFYTDLEKINTMDVVPFLELDMENLDEQVIKEVERFNKRYFNKDSLYNNAKKTKYLAAIKEWFKIQKDDVSDELVKAVLSDVYNAKRTQKAIDEFRPIIKKAYNDYINEIAKDKVSDLLVPKAIELPNVEKQTSKIVTTEEELRGFDIVRAILAEVIDLNKVYYRDRQSYFAILYANNDQKPICRLNFNTKKWQIWIADENKEFTRHYIENFVDIFKYKKELIKVAKHYEKK